jgi:acyl-CoA thioester hydrolase
MARIDITLPEQFAFSTEISLNEGHVNYRGHLDNVLLLSVVSEARQRFFESIGQSDLESAGFGIVIADAAVQYRSEAFHGETVLVQMTAGDFTSKGCDLPWRMTEKDSGREVARGKIGIVFFDYATRKAVLVPESFRQRFAICS